MERPDDKPSAQNQLKPTKGDHAHTAAKAALAAVPVVGGSAAEVLGALIRPPITKRLEAWCDEITRRLGELEQQIPGLDGASLPANEEFISTVQHATQIAVRTHQEEKLEALRNAVLNVAAGTAPGDDLQLMFLTFVDAFTPWHMRILKFFQKPEQSIPTSALPSTATLYEVIGEAFSIGSLSEGFCQQVFLDLVNRSLVTSPVVPTGPIATAIQSGTHSALHVRLARNQATEKRTTPLGDAFLAFIESPAPCSGDS